MHSAFDQGVVGLTNLAIVVHSPWSRKLKEAWTLVVNQGCRREIRPDDTIFLTAC